jgi:hypothetical protein
MVNRMKIFLAEDKAKATVEFLPSSEASGTLELTAGELLNLIHGNCSPASYAATGRGFPARVRRIAAIARIARRRAVSITERISA